MDYHGAFVAAVSRGRGVPATTVERDFGEGRVLGSKQALKVGMIDGIAPDLRMALAGGGARSSRAALSQPSARLAMQRRQLEIWEREIEAAASADAELRAMLSAQGWKPRR